MLVSAIRVGLGILRLAILGLAILGLAVWGLAVLRLSIGLLELLDLLHGPSIPLLLAVRVVRAWRLLVGLAWAGVVHASLRHVLWRGRHAVWRHGRRVAVGHRCRRRHRVVGSEVVVGLPVLLGRLVGGRRLVVRVGIHALLHNLGSLANLVGSTAQHNLAQAAVVVAGL